MIKGALDELTDYSFDVKYNKKGRNPQGRVKVIIQSWYDSDGLLDNVLHTYIATSNAISVLAVNEPTDEQAYFSSKATLKEQLPGGDVSISGNNRLEMWLTDEGNNGDPDGEQKLGIQLNKKHGGMWFSTNWDAGTGMTQEQVLVDGNQCYISPDQSNQLRVTPIEAQESIHVYPNPFIDYVTFHYVPESDCNVKLDLFDIHGRLVQTLFDGNVEAGTKYEFEYQRAFKVDGMLFYRLTRNDKVTTGKLLHSNL